MTVKLIGMDDATPVGYGGGTYQSICRFQAVASGDVTEFKVKCSGNGTIAYSIYDDDSGSPKNRLGQQATPQAVVSGWNTLALSTVALVSGSYYWLAVYVATGDIGYNTSGGTRKYKSGASTFPDPFSADGFSDDSVPVFAAGWGTETSTTIIPDGIASALAFGAPALGLVPSGIASTLAFGTPAIKLVPQGIASTLAFGVPALSVIIRPTGIASTLSFGTPAVFGGVIVVTGIASTLAFGVPEIIGGTIKPSGIASTLVFGVPTIVVYLPHRILEGSYLEESPDFNYVFVVGEDATGAQVSGSSQDTTEAGLVGSRLDANHDPAVPSAAVAAAVAAARIARARLDKKKAVITIPPHCGVELWDVVSVYDTVANQNGLYRVVGYRFEYDARKSVYQHVIELSTV